MKDRIVLMGLPGSGKTASGRVVANVRSIPYVSSGDIARSLGTPAGQMAEETAMRQQIKSALSQCDDGFVLDGCPRFLDQAQWLRSAIGKYTIYCLAVDSSVAISRLLERGRPDDTHDIILRRVAEYKTMTRPILAAVHHGELDCGLHVIRVAGKTAYAVAMEILVLNGRR